MIGKILKKDLLKNRVTNVLLFLLICISIVLLSGSVTMVLSDTSSINQYLDNSNVADYTVYSSGEEAKSKILSWAKTSKYVDSYIEDELIKSYNGAFDLEGIKDVRSDIMVGKVSVDHNTCYTMNNEIIKEVQNGQMYFPYTFKSSLNIKTGETFKFTMNGVTKEYTFMGYFKDSVFLNDFFSFKRVLVSEEDYSLFRDEKDVVNMMNIYSSNEKMVDKDFNKLGINVISAISKSLLKMVFVFDLIIAGVLALVSALLIIIALICLIFTIKFTIKRNYHEIGIMKAIGIDNTSIRFIYLAKYTLITIASLVVGFSLSIPLANALLKSISQTAVIKANPLYYVIAFLVSLLISILIVLVGYLSTIKVTKIKPLTALKGEEIKSSKRKTKISVASSYKAPVLLMALRDNVKHLSRSIILCIVFILSILTIVIPSNAINTLNSNKVVPMFGYANFDYTFSKEDVQISSYEVLNASIDGWKKELKNNNIESMFYSEVQYGYSVHGRSKEDSKTIYCLKLNGISNSEYQCSGRAPKYANEVALGTKSAEYFDVVIGDTIFITIDGNEKPFIVTCTYDTMMNMGHGIRFGDEYIDNHEEFYDCTVFARIDKEEKTIQKIFEGKDTIVKSAEEKVDRLLGSIKSQFTLIKNGIALLIVVIEFAFVTLICKLIMDRDYTEFALLKSIGFKTNTLIKYEMYRIGICALIGGIISCIISYPITLVTITPIFSLMGMTKPCYEINGLEAFIIYPIIVVLVGLLGVLTTYRTIKKIKAIEVKE